MTRVTAQSIADLKKALPKCKIFWDDPSKSDPNRAVAEWALRYGGKVSLYQKDKGFTSVAEPSEFPQDAFVISFLELRGAKPTSAEFSQLDQLTNLTYIDLGGSTLGANRLEFFSKNKRLRFIRLLRCGILDSDLEHLSGLTKELVTLDLANNRLTNNGLTHLSTLTNLKMLDLQGNLKITDAGLKPLQSLSKLGHLALFRTAVTDAGVKQVGTALPRCTIIYHKNRKDTLWPSNPRAETERRGAEWVLSVGGTVTVFTPGGENVKYDKSSNLPKTRFTVAKVDLSPARKLADSDLKHLSELHQLSALILSNQLELTDEGLVHLAELKKLAHLHINNTRFTGTGFKYLKDSMIGHLNMMTRTVTDERLKHLAQLKRLKSLDLQATGITDAGLKILAGYKNVQKMNLIDTKISDAGLAHLKSSKQLEQLQLRGTKVTAGGIADLKKSLPKCKITK